MTTQNYDYLFKIVIIGDWNVGKTSLLMKFVEDLFDQQGGYMIYCDFKIKLIQLDGKVVKLQIWDTRATRRNRTYPITRSHFRGARGILLVYDVTNEKSFEDISSWLDIIADSTYTDMVKVLVGNKCDLTSQKVVEYDAAKSFADQHGLTLLETSASDGTNVEQAFVRLATEIKRMVDLSPPPEDSRKKTDCHKCHIS